MLPRLGRHWQWLQLTNSFAITWLNTLASVTFTYVLIHRLL